MKKWAAIVALLLLWFLWWLYRRGKAAAVRKVIGVDLRDDPQADAADAIIDLARPRPAAAAAPGLESFGPLPTAPELPAPQLTFGNDSFSGGGGQSSGAGAERD